MTRPSVVLSFLLGLSVLMPAGNLWAQSPGWGTAPPRPPPQPAPAPQSAPAPPPAYPPPAQPGYSQPGYSQPVPQYQSNYGRSKQSTPLEIGVLYATAAAWGIGLGIWVDAEAGVSDPGLRVIAPLLMGAAAPVGVFALDHPPMPEGLPAATAAGLILGAGEGLGIASYQHVTADEGNEWGFKGLARSVAFGSTVGGVAGYAVGYYAEPDPASTVMLSSGALWGTMIGASIGYGATSDGLTYGQANDGAALGGLIGFNSGLVVGAALAFTMEPSWHQLGWMWLGAGLGAVVSAPFYLLYIPDDAPPAKRGLIITGTAIGVGTIAGAIIGSGHVQERLSADVEQPAWLQVVSIHPIAVEGGMGAGVTGFW